MEYIRATAVINIVEPFQRMWSSRRSWLAWSFDEGQGLFGDIAYTETCAPEKRSEPNCPVSADEGDQRCCQSLATESVAICNGQLGLN